MGARAIDCSAPSYDLLIGRVTGNPVRMLLPKIAEGLLSFLPARVRAESDPAVDVVADDGRRLSAYDAASGAFVVRMGTATLSLGKEARLRTHPHDPDAPIGFYNARRARVVIEQMRSLVQAAISDPRSSRVSRLRAQLLDDRLALLEAQVDALCAELWKDPSLVELEVGLELSRSVKKRGDEASEKLDEILRKLGTRAPDDCAILARDREKWVAWHKSSVGAFYLDR